jgi:hypothetical protein
LAPVAPVTKQKAGQDLRDRHPQIYPGGPRVNLRADEDLLGVNAAPLAPSRAGRNTPDEVSDGRSRR